MNISPKGPSAVPQRKEFAMGESPAQGRNVVNTNTPASTTGSVKCPTGRR